MSLNIRRTSTVRLFLAAIGSIMLHGAGWLLFGQLFDNTGGAPPVASNIPSSTQRQIFIAGTLLVPPEERAKENDRSPPSGITSQGNNGQSGNRYLLGNRYYAAAETSEPAHVLSSIALGTDYLFGDTGRISLHVFLDEQGKVDDVRLVSQPRHTRIEAEALEKFRSAEYSVSMLNGIRVKSWLAIEIMLTDDPEADLARRE